MSGCGCVHCLTWRVLCVGLGHAVWTDRLSVCVYGNVAFWQCAV